jgi:ABC-2 type transport system permease protein
VESLQSIFLAGDLWPQLVKNMLMLIGVAILFFGITLSQSHKRLD